jgi:hypothetical protein
VAVPAPPALAHIWAIAALAYGMQFMRINQIAYVRIFFPHRKFYTKPVGLALSLAYRYYRQINHKANLVKNVILVLVQENLTEG